MSGMAFRPRKVRGQVHLSVTPLIDVLFLLIIFFTLTGTFKRAGELELRLPESSTATPAETGEGEPTPAELVVLESGELLLDGDPVTRPDLKGRLEARLLDDPSGSVMIKAEAGVDHGDVVLLLDTVRAAGYPGVGIGTYRRPSAEPVE